jgi:hypothetical protein
MKIERLSAVSGMVVSLAVIFVSVSQGQEWTRFRGPNGQGISHARNIPVKWTDDDYNWKVNVTESQVLTRARARSYGRSSRHFPVVLSARL